MLCALIYKVNKIQQITMKLLVHSKTKMASYRKLQIVSHSFDFKSSTEVVTVPRVEPGPDEVRIRVIYGGVNATDLHAIAGRVYGDGKLPFDLGLEALGYVDALGSSVPVGKFQIGQTVLALDKFNLGGFSEYVYKPLDRVFAVPDLNPKYLATLTNGLTAAIAIDKQAHIKKGEKVLITAAAGGTGQIFLQLAKQAGAYVIALTSSAEKAQYLQELGADFIINYKEQNLDQVLTDKFPNGVDVVWETIGGDTFKILFNHLAIGGRLLVIGSITSYKTSSDFSDEIDNLKLQLLFGSKSYSGFGIWNHIPDFSDYLPKLISDIQSGQLKVKVDFGEAAPGGQFVGLDHVHRAQEWLYSGKSVGKIVVKVQKE